MLPNKIIYTKELAGKVFGEETIANVMTFCEKLNKLNLKDTEKAALFAFLVTKYSE